MDLSQAYHQLIASTRQPAVAIEGAFVETILHGKTEKQLVSRAYVEQRAWTEFTTVRPFKLMKLYDEGLFRHGTDASISAMPSYTRYRQIALATFREDPDLDGIAYRSRHDNGELCFALFDRVTSSDFDTGRTRLFREQPHVSTTPVCPFRRRRERYGAVLNGSPERMIRRYGFDSQQPDYCCGIVQVCRAVPDDLVVPSNLSLLRLPPYSPELNIDTAAICKAVARPTMRPRSARAPTHHASQRAPRTPC